ncbi:type II toxin-antitoxin system PemK/MazF family toxin [Ideonella azotifigens]|uniref:Growth inhibitor PemK n=1 Tax=Ideonella azotifigens TaxID=513160 RepID=A0ABN1KC47_9BURK|nr:type II toxin-antitoxin system PemK/MazF family toxin [Ideonella azotifigens]MCD2343022.1 type II toxin-antitoxin system PemK/MazF family toxin [Ideonella azotifigens]
MAFPAPVPGLVIRYSYLWSTEHARGQEEGVKDRPCAVILVTTGEEGNKVVTVLPITHASPTDLALAIEIPPDTKRRLGLDGERSWVVLTEANRFIWPGPDLRPTTPGNPDSLAHGLLPHGLFEAIRLRFIDLIKARQARSIPRTE